MAWCIFALFSSSAFKIALAAVFVLDLFIQLSAAWFDGDLSASSSVSSTGDGSRSSSPGTHPNEATDDRVLLTAPTVHDSPTTSEGHLLSFHYAHSCDDLLLLFVARAVLFVVLGNLAVHRWRKIMESARDEIMVCEEVVVVEGRPVAGPGMVAAVMAGEKGEARELQNVVEGAAVAAVQGGGFDASLKEPLNGGARNGGVGLGGSRNGGDATSDDSTTSGSSASSVGAAARAVVCGTTATCGVGGVVSTSENEIKGITRVDGTAIKDLADPAAQLSTSSIVKKTAYIQLADKAELHKVVLVYLVFACSFAMSVYTGVKTVVFKDPPTQPHVNVLIGIGVVLINLEFVLLREFVEDRTKEQGELIPNLHMHPLFFAVDLQCHNCDVCQERTKAPHYEAWRCRTCDFDLCSRCYRRRNNPDFKGVAFRNTAAVSAEPAEASSASSACPRTQDAAGAASTNNPSTSPSGSESLSTYGYFRKCVSLCLEFWPTLALATGSLVLCQICALIAPNLQGRIFDAIIGKVVSVEGGGAVVLRPQGLVQWLDPTKIFFLPTSLPDSFPADGSSEVLLSAASVGGNGSAPGAPPNPIQPDEARFHRIMRIYILVNVLTGLFNGLRSLGIELSMRSLAAVVRRRLFHAIIKIDIAHFDALHTGQLTSRLTNDVGAMVQPMSTIMNDLVSNSILLVGGSFYV